MTRLQVAAYDAQRAAGLPVSELATGLLILKADVIDVGHCLRYVQAVQQMDWFNAAFPAHTDAVAVVGGKGVSHADAVVRRIKIGTADRRGVGQCEQACLHELAHLVSRDFGADGQRREPGFGRYSSKGHHHAWRVNFLLIVRKALGRQAALRLRHEFIQWGLPTRK